MARAIRNRPAPSRRCSGSRSRADCPIERATAPRAWAMPSQTDATPRPRPPNVRATGPGPLRTARGRRTLWRSAASGRAGAALARAGSGALGGTPGSGARGLAPHCLGRRWNGTCSSSATPAGKTYGSPCRDPTGESHQPHGSHGACRAHGRPRDSGRANTTCYEKPPLGVFRVSRPAFVRWPRSLGQVCSEWRLGTTGGKHVKLLSRGLHSQSWGPASPPSPRSGASTASSSSWRQRPEGHEGPGRRHGGRLAERARPARSASSASRATAT